MHITHYTGVECNVKCRPHYTLHITLHSPYLSNSRFDITHYTLHITAKVNFFRFRWHITHYTLHCAISVISYPSHITHYRLQITHYTPYPNHHSNPETCPLHKPGHCAISKWPAWPSQRANGSVVPRDMGRAWIWKSAPRAALAFLCAEVQNTRKNT